MEHHRLTERGRGMSDPGSGPYAVGRVGLNDALGLEGKGSQRDGKDGKNSAHGKGPFDFQFPSIKEMENQRRNSFNRSGYITALQAVWQWRVCPE